MKICDVLHEIEQSYRFDPAKAKEKIEDSHPLGDVYTTVNGWGYVQSGYDWLRFSLNHLSKLKRGKLNFDESLVREEYDRQHALAALRKILLPGSKVYTITRSHARRGAIIAVLVLVICGDEEEGCIKTKINNLSDQACAAIDFKWSNDSIVASGWGQVVNRLSFALHGYEDKGENPDLRAPTQYSFKAGHSLIEVPI
jgi:hypothetical protein